MRWPTVLAVFAAGVAGTTIAKLMVPHDGAQHELLVHFDRLWQHAVELGYNGQRKPQVAFVNADDLDHRVAQTRCDDRPVIEVSRQYLAAHPGFVDQFVPVHEMAHVLVCLGGSSDDWNRGHGGAWETAVRLLVDRATADEVIEVERVLEPPPLRPDARRPLTAFEEDLARDILEEERR